MCRKRWLSCREHGAQGGGSSNSSNRETKKKEASSALLLGYVCGDERMMMVQAMWVVLLRLALSPCGAGPPTRAMAS